jgi:hypothetical protein
VATVTLLTDCGPASEHVGALHALIARRCPEAVRVDLAHDIPPGDVRRGAAVLARVAPLAGPAIHLAVVDPGVGTDRRGVAVACHDGSVVVGPDNGLLAPLCARLGAARAVELASAAHRREPVAPTFHGRDVFAPAVAHLAAGGALDDLGPGVDPAGMVVLSLPPPAWDGAVLVAAVSGSDRFGNVQLVAGAKEWDALAPRMTVCRSGGDGIPARRGRVFADVDTGEVVVHVDADGHLAVAAREASAVDLLGVRGGDLVRIAPA